MGLMSDIKSAVTGGDGSDETEESPEVEDMFEDGEGPDETLEESMGDEVGEPEVGDEPEEEEQMEWESAYEFAEWFLEDEGFADMIDFGDKVMMKKLEQSPMYRDRIENGLQTLSNINSAKQQLQEIKGEETSDRDYSEMADRLEDANRVIENTRKLSGEDEMIVQQGMSLARDAVEAIGSKASAPNTSVDTTTETTNEEI